MQKHQYAEMLLDDQDGARERERVAIDRSIALLERAVAEDAAPGDITDAVAYTSHLWTVFMEDLCAPDNSLPLELKAKIISIGIWVLRELELARGGRRNGLLDIIDVSRVIQKGLQ